MTEEVWRPIKNYEGSYEVSDMGRVRSLDREISQICRWGTEEVFLYKGKILSPGWVGALRHQFVVLVKNGNRENARVHVLVLDAFVGPRPSGFYAAHLNGNPKDNRVRNLQWVTPKENSFHRRQHGTHIEGTDVPWSKLNPDKVREIRKLAKQGVKDMALSKIFGICREVARNARTGKSWKHVV